MSVFLKDPNAVLDYANDWSDYLASGETISTSTWAIEGGDSSLTLAGSGDSISGAITTSPMLSSGTKGQVYTLRNRIVTSQGRTDDRVHTIRMEPR